MSSAKVSGVRTNRTGMRSVMRSGGVVSLLGSAADRARYRAETLGGMLAQGLTFDRLFSSPYRRALHTAQILGAGFGLEPETDDRLREISFGPYEGTRYGEGLFADDNIRACFLDPPRYIARDGAEPFDAVAARVRDFIDRTLVPLAATCARVLVVAHGGILRTVLRLVGVLSLDDFWKGPQPNCCSHVVTLADGKLALKARAVVVRRFGKPKSSVGEIGDSDGGGWKI